MKREKRKLYPPAFSLNGRVFFFVSFFLFGSIVCVISLNVSVSVSLSYALKKMKSKKRKKRNSNQRKGEERNFPFLPRAHDAPLFSLSPFLFSLKTHQTIPAARWITPLPSA